MVTHNPKIVEIPTFCGFDHKGWGIELTGESAGLSHPGIIALGLRLFVFALPPLAFRLLLS